MTRAPLLTTLAVMFDRMPVGTLRRNGGLCTFEWADAYLDQVASGMVPLLPRGTPAANALPLIRGEQRYATHAHFDDLPGFLWDALPDSWGSLVMDRTLSRLRITPTPLSKLAYLGRRGMGGLTFSPALASGEPDSDQAETIATARLTELSALLGSWKDGTTLEEIRLLEKLAANAGSPGGAHPKCLVGIHPETKAMIWGADTDVFATAPDYRPAILKLDFAATEHLYDPEYAANVTRIEMAYNHLARAAGLHPPQYHLIPSTAANGAPRWHLALERFDRAGPHRRHQITYAALTHTLHSTAAAWYNELPETLHAATDPIAGTHDLFRRAVFNYATGVTDDHLKNHALLRDDTGWSLAPPYDLLWSPKPDHATLLSGFAKPETLDDGSLRHLAQACALAPAQAARIVGEVLDAVTRWHAFAAAAHLDPACARRIADTLNRHLALMAKFENLALMG